MSTDQTLMQALGFTAQDLEANRRGILTEAQRARFAAILTKDTSFMLQIAALVMIAVVIGAVAFVIINPDIRDYFSSGSNALILIVPGGALLYYVLMIAAQARRSNRQKATTTGVVSVTGKVTVAPVSQQFGHNLPGAVAVQIAGGLPRSYLIQVGKEKLYVDQPTAEAFQNGGVYRIFYLKPVQIIVSAEIAHM